jgi:hypothetical protein
MSNPCSRHHQPSNMASTPLDKTAQRCTTAVVIAHGNRRAPRQDLQRRRGYTTCGDVHIASARPIRPSSHAPLSLPRPAWMRPRPATSASKPVLSLAIQTLHTVERTACYSRSAPFLFDPRMVNHLKLDVGCIQTNPGMRVPHPSHPHCASSSSRQSPLARNTHRV